MKSKNMIIKILIIQYFANKYKFNELNSCKKYFYFQMIIPNLRNC